MKNLWIIANLKSNENLDQVNDWISKFLESKNSITKIQNKQIVVCPSFPHLFSFHSAFKDTNIKVGAQNLSSFDEGAYTGEVNAKQIKDFADFVIIGHSEERSILKETDSSLSEKVKLSIQYGLTPIFCVQNSNESIPQGVQIIAYEPTFAIGTGTPDNPENAEKVASSILSKFENAQVLYGGSVNSKNVNGFTKQPNIKGVLVGSASLNPLEFIKIIENA